MREEGAGRPEETTETRSGYYPIAWTYPGARRRVCTPPHRPMASLAPAADSTCDDDDHCRKAASLFAELSNEYEEVKLKLTEYKYAPSPVEEVLELHEKIVARKKDCMDDAEQDYDRCIRMYND